jgi:threonyl-tRNA synthetase
MARSNPIANEFYVNIVGMDVDFCAAPIGRKIANTQAPRVHTMLVIGARDMEAGAVSVRLHHGGPQGAKRKAEVIGKILADIKERKA